MSDQKPFFEVKLNQEVQRIPLSVGIPAVLAPALVFWWKGFPPAFSLAAIGFAAPALLPSLVDLPNSWRSVKLLAIACFVCGFATTATGLMVWGL